MDTAYREVDRLVLGQDQRLLVATHVRGTGHYDPVLGPVVVHLHRELSARVDRDPLDLETVPGVDRVVLAPGTVDLTVELGLGSA